ncbi:hypothetical protein OA405_01590 [Bacteroidota bacterium]|nr:hypothetical protein [Bacteroidota bacterium]MDC3115453.1 hypothetical protein [Bacteroidota bacterium]
MNKLHFLLLAVFIIFSSCEREESTFSVGCEEECNEWERCTNVSDDFFDWNWQCRPKLDLYTSHGSWGGELNFTDESGNIHSYQLHGLNALTQGLQNISLEFPVNSFDWNGDLSIYNYLILNFINSETLEFTINDVVYDPHVQSNVRYIGTGQLIQTGGSWSTVLEFDCDFIFDNKNYSVSFSATRD